MERYSRLNMESTPKESPTTPTSPKRFPWGGRYTNIFRRKQSDSPTIPEPSPKRIQKRSRINDPQTLLDAQSPGLAFRVNKYYDESHRKPTRQLINPRYTTIGDFPIVNLDKAKHVIKVQPTTVTATTATAARITPPVRNSYFMQSRASIMSGGRVLPNNEQQTYNNGTHSPVANENEPLVSHEGEYETAPTRSVLDALKEISRKRIHCDDLDEDQHKKQRSEMPPNITIENNTITSDINSKRAREKTSPNAQPVSAHVKRFRHNEITSSLSSSIHLLNPRRNLDLTQDISRPETAKRPRDDNVDGYQQPQQRPTTSSIMPDEKDRSNNKVDERHFYEKTSVTDEVNATPPRPTITLFNRDYSTLTPLSDDDDSDEEVQRRKLFVKPKAKIENVFQLPKGRKEASDRSRLMMMLKALAGITNDDSDDDDLDETDAGIEQIEKLTDKSPEISPIVSNAAPVSSINTTLLTPVVTSTAVSVAVSSTTPTPSVQQAPRMTNFGSLVSAPTTTNTDITPAPITVSLPPPSIIAKPTANVTVSTSINVIPPTPTTTIASTSPNRIGGFSFPVSSTTQTITSTPNKVAPNVVPPNTLLSPPTISAPVSVPSPVPAFSFGLPKTTSPTVVPSITTSSPNSSTVTFGSNNIGTTTPNVTKPLFSFGATPAIAASTAPQTTVTSSPALFSFSSPVAAPPVAAPPVAAPPVAAVPVAIPAQPTLAPPPATSSQPIMFGSGNLVPASTVAPTQFSFKPATTVIAATTTPATNLFSFGASNTTSNTAPTTTTTGANASPMFSFGAQDKSKPVPTFGSGGSAFASNPAATNTISNTFKFGEVPNAQAPATALSSSPFQFNSADNKTQTAPPPAYGSTFASVAATTTAPAMMFGSTPAAQAPPNVFGNLPSTTASSTPANPAFTFGSTAPKPADPPAFGSQIVKPTFGGGAFSNAQAPTFGSLSSNQNNSVFAANPPAFGNNNSTFPTGQPNAFGGSETTTPAPPVFGSGSFGSNATVPATTAPATGFGTSAPQPSVFTFGGAANPAPATSPFAFGPTASSNQPSNGPAFGFNANANTAPAPTNSNTPFNFGAPAPSPFGAPATNAAKPFAFGASAPAPAQSPFAFNSNSATADVNKPFAFGTPTNDSASAFAYNSGPATAPAAAPAFNFNAAPANPALSANAFQFNAGAGGPMGQSPVFSIGTGGGQTTKRPIRQATRRIK